jgi:phosphoesterase RecJ-like protein
LGKQADLVTADRVPKIHRALPGADGIRTAQRVDGPYDAVILLECDGLERTRLIGLEQFFKVNIDHHATGRAYADLNWIDRSVASVGEMVYRLVKGRRGPGDAGDGHLPLHHGADRHRGLLLRRDAGFHLRSGAGTGAGRGRPAAHRTAGVFFHARLEAAAAGRGAGQSAARGPAGLAMGDLQDMVRACAVEEDCEGIVNFALCVSGVEAAVFLYEQPEGRIQVSLRSKGNVNVAAIAERLGGGGHVSASGCTLEGPLERAREEILAQLRPSVALLEGEADG